jgi:hypothetical protein
MYMVTSGTHVNSSCCFDFGNAETNNNDNGNGHMDALNFGTECWWYACFGSGPWVQADMENGLFQSDEGVSKNTANTGFPDPFVTAVLNNNGQNYLELRGGNAQSGSLTTEYSGPEPWQNIAQAEAAAGTSEGAEGVGGGYAPMHQEGAVVLGTGGDDSNTGVGSFFEGVMTSGTPSDQTDDAVQASVVSAGYGS